MADKNYAQGVYVRAKAGQHGEFFAVSGDTAKFADWLKSISDENGQFRLTITKRREPSQSGVTHSVYEDTWKPNGRGARPADPAPDRAFERPAVGLADVPKGDGTDGLPF